MRMIMFDGVCYSYKFSLSRKMMEMSRQGRLSRRTPLCSKLRVGHARCAGQPLSCDIAGCDEIDGGSRGGV